MFRNKSLESEQPEQCKLLFYMVLFDCSSVPVAAGGGAIYIFSGYPADVEAT